MEKYLEKGITLLMEHGPKILLAIVILFVGLFVIKQIVKTMNKIMLKRKLDASLHSFIKSLAKSAIIPLRFGQSAQYIPQYAMFSMFKLIICYYFKF